MKARNEFGEIQALLNLSDNLQELPHLILIIIPLFSCCFIVFSSIVFRMKEHRSKPRSS